MPEGVGGHEVKTEVEALLQFSGHGISVTLVGVSERDDGRITALEVEVRDDRLGVGGGNRRAHGVHA